MWWASLGPWISKMATERLQALGRALWGRALRPQKTLTALDLDVEEKVATLSNPARIALWHLKDRRLPGALLREKLAEARVSANVDQVINELFAACLIDHDFTGNQFVRPEVAAIVRHLLP